MGISLSLACFLNLSTTLSLMALESTCKKKKKKNLKKNYFYLYLCGGS
jgi:hypothetical protein